MKRNACAVLSVLVAVAGVGCAITNYSVIVDNDQVSNGRGSGVVNADGKAMMRVKPYATVYPDGVDRTFSMVDQKASGDLTSSPFPGPPRFEESPPSTVSTRTRRFRSDPGRSIWIGAGRVCVVTDDTA